MNKRPLNTITPLLCITIRLENYIELRINDEYSTPIFQYRFEQYFSNPWKEPKKPIKTKLMNHSGGILVQQHQQQNSQQYYRDYTEYKPLSFISNNLDRNNFINDRRMIEPVQSTSNNSRYDIDRYKISHRKEKDESRTLKNKHSQTDTVYVVNDQKSWEVDIKHIRYDPIQGNILDDNGSVYLYPAHEID
uniref:Uncharacterized protein n=1 Tax=Schistosoma japonicum TaxID=6182 RepID=Q5DB67_SCHJA|nr:unknown [Schistosoma japonicum]